MPSLFPLLQIDLCEGRDLLVMRDMRTGVEMYHDIPLDLHVAARMLHEIKGEWFTNKLLREQCDNVLFRLSTRDEYLRRKH